MSECHLPAGGFHLDCGDPEVWPGGPGDGAVPWAAVDFLIGKPGEPFRPTGVGVGFTDQRRAEEGRQGQPLTDRAAGGAKGSQVSAAPVPFLSPSKRGSNTKAHTKNKKTPCTVGGNVQWCSPDGKQKDSSSKN